MSPYTVAFKVNQLQRRVNDLEQALEALQKAQEPRVKADPNYPARAVNPSLLGSPGIGIELDGG